MKAESPLSSKAERSTAIRFIVCLGVVSLFADMTYEGAHSIIGPFLKALGAFLALLVARIVRPGKNVPPPPPTTQALPRVFWFYAAAAGILACGFLDFPLLAYHFEKSALVQPAVIPLLYAGAMGVNGLTALIFGRLFDRYDIRVLSFGILLSLLALPFGFLGGTVGVVVSVACWA